MLVSYHPKITLELCRQVGGWAETGLEEINGDFLEARLAGSAALFSILLKG